MPNHGGQSGATTWHSQGKKRSICVNKFGPIRGRHMATISQETGRKTGGCLLGSCISNRQSTIDVAAPPRWQPHGGRPWATVVDAGALVAYFSFSHHVSIFSLSSFHLLCYLSFSLILFSFSTPWTLRCHLQYSCRNLRYHLKSFFFFSLYSSRKAPPCWIWNHGRWYSLFVWKNFLLLPSKKYEIQNLYPKLGNNSWFVSDSQNKTKLWYNRYEYKYPYVVGVQYALSNFIC